VRSLLVTGGAGFIGSNFVRYWLERHADDRVVVLDKLTYAGNLVSLEDLRADPRLTFVHGDIAAPGLAEGLLRQHQAAILVHFAAESHVDRSIVNPEQFLKTNVLGTHVLLEAARAVGLGRFHHVSTDEVYGSLPPAAPPATEDSPYQPNSPYAASKAASDHLVRAYHHTYGLATTVTNCTNNHGPYQFPEKLIPLMVLNALEGKPLPIYGDGLNVRDWLHVEDHCRAIELVLETGKLGEVYNVGGDNQWTNLALVQLLCRLLDEAFADTPALAARFPQCPASQRQTGRLISFVPDRPGHDRRYAVNSEKIRGALGFVSSGDLDNGLRKTIGWYLDNQAWWQTVRTGAYRDWIRHWYGDDS
jgi:dTDP-glucose 4,6-dehydratase